MVANSMVKHSIAGGDYGLRRREVESRQSVLSDTFPELHDLGDATLSQRASWERAMLLESYKRCRHLISENGRVLEARTAMIEGNPEHLGSRTRGSARILGSTRYFAADELSESGIAAARTHSCRE